MNVCIITSMLSFPDKPLSYSKVRSVFSPAERTEQTLHSIKSVRQRIPGCKVVIVEIGPERSAEVWRACDYHIHAGKRRIVQWATNSPFKGLGEAIGLIVSANEIYDRGGDYYFKVSGRYYLNDKFQLTDWNGFRARCYGKSISTRLYGFSRYQFERWRRALWWSIPLLAVGCSLESEMYRHLGRWPIHPIDVLGVSGQIATDGTVIHE